jgi:hypothetical protein
MRYPPTTCGEIHLSAAPMVKRLLNQALFERFEVSAEYVVTYELRQPLGRLLEAAVSRREAASEAERLRAERPLYMRASNRGRRPVHRPAFAGLGLKDDYLVGDRGFEPR